MANQKQATELGRYRQLSGVPRIVVRIISVILMVMLIFLSTGVFSNKYIYIYPMQIFSLGLSLLLILAFYLVPANKSAPRDKIPWYDYLFMATGAAPGIYYFFTYPEKIYIQTMSGMHELILSALLLVTLLEAARRITGWVVTLLGIIFWIYPMISHLLPAFLKSRQFTFWTLQQKLYLTDTGMFGGVVDVVFTTLFAFLLFSSFLNETGAGKFFTNFALSIAGRFRGGPAKVAIIASAVFGTISGSAAANVAATGVITIPLMKRAGYKPAFAGAIEACASTGGQLVPPVMGVVIFIMADILEMDYWDICLAAIIPSFLYYLGLYFQVDLAAKREGLQGLLTEEIPCIKDNLKEGIIFLIPIISLFYFLGVLRYAPTTAALYALICLLLITSIRKKTRLNVRNLLHVTEDTSRLMLDITILCSLISILITSVSITGIATAIASSMINFSGGNLFILLILTGICCYIFGMGMPIVPSYIFLALMIAPALIQMGIQPLVAHMFILYYALSSMITPPVCPAAFIAASIAQAPMLKTGFVSMRLGIILLLIPFIFVYSPALLLIGSPGEIVLAFSTSAIGVYMLSSALSGSAYFLRTMAIGERIMMGIGGILTILPGWMTDLIGIAILVLTVIAQFVRR